MITKRRPLSGNRYHPVVNFLLRPIYKSCGGRYNPLVAENVVGVASYVFHTALISAVSGGLADYIHKGDLKYIGYASLFSLFFPVAHGIRSVGGYLKLKKEKEEYKRRLIKQGESQNIDSLVETEFQKRRTEYAATPKFYTGFESNF